MSEPTQAKIDPSTGQTGRNEPCPCGSGKKFKRCHGVGAAPKITPAKEAGPTLPGAAANPAFPAGLDPSQFDPQMMQQFAQSLQRLPKGQLQRLQSLMQRAMSGKDVSKESEDFERTLPVEFQQLMRGFASTAMAGQMGGQLGGMNAPGSATDIVVPPGSAPAMTEEEARRIVEAAAAQGKIAAETAEDLLKKPDPKNDTKNEKKGFGRLWGSKT
jgi:hypothetical protein